METFKIEHLTFAYPGKGESALSDICLSVEQGEFITLCGKSGCGKSTLLRQLKTVLAPHGTRSGDVLFEGVPLAELSQRTQTEKIGFVLQSPENQIVTDKVWHELAFGLESLGYDTPTIRLRVAEMASFFGIQTWFHKKVTELSGGQKQLLNLAAVMAMQPSVLILDEPTSQLDPIAATDFLETIGKINRELGTTILLTEHRLEDALPMSDRVIVMDEGRVLTEGTPEQIGKTLKDMGHDMFLAMPTPMRVYAGVDNDLPCPVTVRDGRRWLTRFSESVHLRPELIPEARDAGTEKKSVFRAVFKGAGAGVTGGGIRFRSEAAQETKSGERQDTRRQEQRDGRLEERREPVIELSEVWFKYERELPDVVKGLSATIYAGEFYAIVGGNGTGKTTSISLMTGLLEPYRGTVKIKGKKIGEAGGELYGGILGILPQNPQALFVKKTVELDLLEMFSGRNVPRSEQRRRLMAVSHLCELENLLQMHPYDLSGGEQQRAALAKVLLTEPELLILDEPTKGLDGHFKQKLARILSRLRQAGVTIVMVSHDIEFCARYADRCAMFFDGSITGEAEPRRFFCGKSFYTTAANRMARSLLPQAVLAEDIIAACGGTPEPERVNWDDDLELYGNSGLHKMGESSEDWKPDGEDGSSGGLFGGKNERTASHKKSGEGGSGRNCSITANEEIVLKSDRQKLTPGRIVLGLVFTSLFILTAYFLKGRWVDWRDFAVQLVMFLEIGGALACFLPGRDLDAADFSAQPPRDKRKLSKRTMAAMAMILIAIPFTIYMGIFYFGDRKYYFISMLIILETMLPFVMIFEGRKPQARELIVISVLCAIAVAGRAAFFMLPQFKPVLAVVIIAGVCFGGEAGFLTGAVTMFVSNMLLSQGPWTPWQMFAAGIIGFLAGVLFRKGFLRKRRGALCIFGFITAFFIYGIIMDSASTLMWQAKPTLMMFLLSSAQGLPFNIIHALATAFFLWFISGPMIEKLDRIKVKYGMIE